MKKLLRSNLTPGMIVGEDVFSYANQLIVPKGMVLTDKIITRLEFYSIPYVKVKDDPDEPFDSPVTYCDNEAGSKPAPFLDIPSKSSPYSELIKSSPEFIQYKADFDQTINEFKGSMNDIVQKGAKIDTDVLLSQATHLIDGAPNTSAFFNMLHNMRQSDDLTFAHCMNVALISNILATWLNLSQKEIDTATLCGLLHDIGKLAIPDQIIKKPGKLTPAEYNIVKTHPLESYKMLSRYNLPDEVKNAALMHHERCDGSGYPYGFTAEKINRFAKLVAIADVYEAMTSKRTYREALCPFHVITHFENDGLQKYDPAFLLPFLENVVNTFLNQRVRLTNGLEGSIIFINPVALSKPTVKIGDKFIDLKKVENVEIEEII